MCFEPEDLVDSPFQVARVHGGDALGKKKVRKVRKGKKETSRASLSHSGNIDWSVSMEDILGIL